MIDRSDLTSMFALVYMSVVVGSEDVARDTDALGVVMYWADSSRVNIAARLEDGIGEGKTGASREGTATPCVCWPEDISIGQ